MLKLSLNHLDNDPRNPNICSEETLTKLKANIQRTGLCPPLIVRPHPQKKNRYILIDGHHRKQVLVSLGWKAVECQVWEISDQEAQLALATLNRLRGTDIPQKRAELLNSLTQTLSPDALAELIPENASQIRDLIQLMQTDFEALETALKKEIQQEQETLPIPYTFLIHPNDQPVLEEALHVFSEQGNLSDRARVLIRICAHALEEHRADGST